MFFRTDQVDQVSRRSLRLIPLEKFLKSRSAKIEAMALKDTPGPRPKTKTKTWENNGPMDVDTQKGQKVVGYSWMLIDVESIPNTSWPHCSMKPKNPTCKSTESTKDAQICAVELEEMAVVGVLRCCDSGNGLRVFCSSLVLGGKYVQVESEKSKATSITAFPHDVEGWR